MKYQLLKEVEGGGFHFVEGYTELANVDDIIHQALEMSKHYQKAYVVKDMDTGNILARIVGVRGNRAFNTKSPTLIAEIAKAHGIEESDIQTACINHISSNKNMPFQLGTRVRAAKDILTDDVDPLAKEQHPGEWSGSEVIVRKGTKGTIIRDDHSWAVLFDDRVFSEQVWSLDGNLLEEVE